MKLSRTIKLCAAAIALLIGCGPGESAPLKVELTRVDKRWQLLRDGRVFFVQGSGGTNRLDLLAAAGANCVRTWGADNLESFLDDANKNGLAINSP